MIEIAKGNLNDNSSYAALVRGAIDCYLNSNSHFGGCSIISDIMPNKTWELSVNLDQNVVMAAIMSFNMGWNYKLMAVSREVYDDVSTILLCMV